MTKQKILYQGAEAILIKEDDKIIKRRIKKSYRIPEIDEKLRKLRTRAESKIMEKLLGKINVPKILKVDEKNKEIIMQYIEGKKLSDFLDSFPTEKQLAICKEIGREVGKIHDSNIIHSDLTTSNMILVENSIKKQLKQKEVNKKTNRLIKKISKSSGDLVINNKNINSSEVGEQEKPTKEGKSQIFFIDFGLSFHSSRIEDKAVDLHLLRQALESKHFLYYQKLYKKVVESYNSKDKEKILKQLEKVEKRGRYKH